MLILGHLNVLGSLMGLKGGTLWNATKGIFYWCDKQMHCLDTIFLGFVKKDWNYWFSLPMIGIETVYLAKFAGQQYQMLL